jgi:tetratricopeptide (TPR) repeat protein
MTHDHEEWQQAIARDFLEGGAERFAAPFLASDRPGEVPDTVIGRYRLIEEIGRGGMGTVWRAARADGQFEQEVALKLIKRGMDSDEVLARFMRERQILARLQHRHIARLLDGGVSEDGRPYFVMELAEGLPITTHCERHALGMHARLALFVAACRAVQYAHRSLIVHRDIKPSNVLVTAGGEVMLLDFGVARLLDDQPGDAVTGTARLMTPEYASPELLTGAPVTTASDVYQLGLLLYELVTGKRPWPSGDKEMRRHDPPLPSAIVARLHRDLDAIVLTALHNEPDQRFASAEALAEEVERHLAHQPIRSVAPGWRYRATKFVRRNRFRVAATVALVVVSTVVAAAYSTQIRSERDRAEREAAKVSQSAALLRRFFQGWSPDGADRDRVSSSAVLRGAAERAERELADDPEMLGLILSTIGDLHAALGNLADADSLLGRAFTIQEARSTAPSADLAATLASRGRVSHARAEYLDAEVQLRQALAMYGALLSPERLEVLQVQHELAQTLVMLEKLVEAEALLRDALARAAPDPAFATEISSDLGYVYMRQARYVEAVTLLRGTLAEQQRLFGPLHISTLRTTRALASALRDPADLAEVIAHDREALAIALTLFGERHPETYGSRFALAVQLERAGAAAEAEELTEQVLRTRSPAIGEATVFVAQVLRTQGAVMLMQGDGARADPVLRRALAAFRGADAATNADVGDVLNRLAWLGFVLGLPDSLDRYDQAVTFEQARNPADPPFVTDGYEYLALAARRRGDVALADRLRERAVRLYQHQLQEGHPYRVLAESPE